MYTNTTRMNTREKQLMHSTASESRPKGRGKCMSLGINPEQVPVFKSERVEGLTKQLIRSKILLKLKTQKEEERKQKSKIIKNKLFRTGVFKRAKKLMCYISFGGEVETLEMIKEAQKLGKMVAVPVCKKNRMIRPCILRSGCALKKGAYGVSEPKIKKFLESKDLDLVIVPGVAFSKKGDRLGRGKAFYDCFLKTLPKKTVCIGLAFDFQVLPSLPTTTRDFNVNRVVFA